MKQVFAMLCCVTVFLTSIFSCFAQEPATSDALYGLTVNQHSAPVGVENTIAFGWKLQSTRVGAAQTAYRLELATDAAFETVIWTEEKASALSHAVPYTGDALQSGTDYWWRVTVTTDAGEVLTASSTFTTGLLNEADRGGAVFEIGRAHV